VTRRRTAQTTVRGPGTREGLGSADHAMMSSNEQRARAWLWRCTGRGHEFGVTALERVGRIVGGS
jgi:hypothetical protein